jgi:hypothetical protein
MTEDTITINKREYNQLLKDQLMLQALEETGVDNWSGYDDAVECYQELLEEHDASL